MRKEDDEERREEDKEEKKGNSMSWWFYRIIGLSDIGLPSYRTTGVYPVHPSWLVLSDYRIMTPGLRPVSSSSFIQHPSSPFIHRPATRVSQSTESTSPTCHPSSNQQPPSPAHVPRSCKGPKPVCPAPSPLTTNIADSLLRCFVASSLSGAAAAATVMPMRDRVSHA